MVRRKQAAEQEITADKSDSSKQSNSAKDESQNQDQVSESSIKSSAASNTIEKIDMEEEFKKLFLKAKQRGLTEKDFKHSKILEEIKLKGSYFHVFLKFVLVCLCLFLFVYFFFLFNCLLSWPVSNETLARLWFRAYDADVESEACVIYMPEIFNDVFRPPVECSFCKAIKEVKTVYNISQEEFETLYAYTGVPVVIGDGTANWTAPKYFSFQFFKDIYQQGSQALENQVKHCQFFPYRTNFSSLGEVMDMNEDRALMKDGSQPWYIGW